ncbi:MAG TPA: M48 family metalloprotease [Acidimicrobiales bacterium]|nr:M48 family metalloprotease [Acidimicrobiales bacterium]
MNRNTVKTAVVLAALGVLFIGIGGLIGGTTGLFVGLAIGLVFTGGSYWFSDRIAIAASGARPVSEAEMPHYYAIVRDLTERARMPMPRLYVSPAQQPNAFATGRNPHHAAVAVTAGILQICTWEELRGVLAHEISHVRNRDILIASVAATIAMAITLLARMAAWGGLLFGQGRDQGQNIVELLAMLILAPLAAALLQLALSRSREFQADRSGAELIGDGEPLAQALAKLESTSRRIPMPGVRPEMAPMYIVNPLGGTRVDFSRLFSDHPPTAERIARLRSRSWQRQG